MLTKILLILFSMDAFSKGSVFIIFLLAWLAISRKKIYATKEFFLLLTFSVMYFIADIIYVNGFNITILCCSLSYMVGFNIYRDNILTIDKTMEIFKLCAIGMALHGALNLAYEIYTFGGILYGGIHYDVWTQSQSAVTGQMINYVLIISMAGYIVFNLKKERLLAVLLVIALLHTTIAGGRTIIVLFVVSTILYCVIYLHLAERGQKKQIFRYFWVSAILILTFVIIYQLNVFNIKKVWESSYLYYRFFGASETVSMIDFGRFELKITYMQHLFDYPFGGGHIRQEIKQYSHDFLFDTMDRAGIITGIFLLIYYVKMIWHILKMTKEKEINIYNKVILLTYITVVALQFWVEPIIEGAPIFFYVVLFIDGLISRYLCIKEKDYIQG